jgi:hypothetical protein
MDNFNGGRWSFRDAELESHLELIWIITWVGFAVAQKRRKIAISSGGRADRSSQFRPVTIGAPIFRIWRSIFLSFKSRFATVTVVS